MARPILPPPSDETAELLASDLGITADQVRECYDRAMALPAVTLTDDELHVTAAALEAEAAMLRDLAHQRRRENG